MYCIGQGNLAMSLEDQDQIQMQSRDWFSPLHAIPNNFVYDTEYDFNAYWLLCVWDVLDEWLYCNIREACVVCSDEYKHTWACVKCAVSPQERLGLTGAGGACHDLTKRHRLYQLLRHAAFWDHGRPHASGRQVRTQTIAAKHGRAAHASRITVWFLL